MTRKAGEMRSVHLFRPVRFTTLPVIGKYHVPVMGRMSGYFFLVQYLPKLDTLFLALPVSWKGTLAQYAGRIHREHEGKTEVVIYDYTDSAVPMLARMKQRREKGYKNLGYVVDSGMDRLL
nr:hypothetical protein [Endozoicomonas sp.]